MGFSGVFEEFCAEGVESKSCGNSPISDRVFDKDHRSTGSLQQAGVRAVDMRHQ